MRREHSRRKTCISLLLRRFRCFLKNHWRGKIFALLSTVLVLANQVITKEFEPVGYETDVIFTSIRVLSIITLPTVTIEKLPLWPFWPTDKVQHCLVLLMVATGLISRYALILAIMLIDLNKIHTFQISNIFFAAIIGRIWLKETFTWIQLIIFGISAAAIFLSTEPNWIFGFQKMQSGNETELNILWGLILVTAASFIQAVGSAVKRRCTLSVAEVRLYKIAVLTLAMPPVIVIFQLYPPCQWDKWKLVLSAVIAVAAGNCNYHAYNYGSTGTISLMLQIQNIVVGLILDLLLYRDSLQLGPLGVAGIILSIIASIMLFCTK